MLSHDGDYGPTAAAAQVAVRQHVRQHCRDAAFCDAPTSISIIPQPAVVHPQQAFSMMAGTQVEPLKTRSSGGTPEAAATSALPIQHRSYYSLLGSGLRPGTQARERLPFAKQDVGSGSIILHSPPTPTPPRGGGGAFHSIKTSPDSTSACAGRRAWRRAADNARAHIMLETRRSAQPCWKRVGPHGWPAPRHTPRA